MAQIYGENVRNKTVRQVEHVGPIGVDRLKRCMPSKFSEYIYIFLNQSGGLKIHGLLLFPVCAFHLSILSNVISYQATDRIVNKLGTVNKDETRNNRE